jgi:hypothetical protein
MGGWFSSSIDIADFGELGDDDFVNDRTQKLHLDFKSDTLNQKEEPQLEPITVPLHEENKGGRKLLTSSGRRPKVLFQSVLKQKHTPKNDHYNTTSSIFITDVISNPKLDQVLLCLSTALELHIRNGEAKTDSVYDEIFDETKFPFSDMPINENFDIPVINHFLTYIFQVQQLPAEVAIICIAYVERLMAFTSLCLKKNNWRRIVLSSLLIAAKVWEEQSRWSVDFSQMFNNMSVGELNRLERHMLEKLQYNVTVKASQYVQYYFELRALSNEDHFALSPLDKDALDKLEEKTVLREKKIMNKQSIKTQSLQNLKIRRN